MKGAGDTAEVVFKALSIHRVAAKVAELLGEEDCGCEKRKEALNKLIPYKSDEEC